MAEKSTDIETVKKRKESPKKRIAPVTLIVKPDCMSQGRGIFLTNDIEQIPKEENLIVQEYIHHPYLVDKLKFDIRLYVLVLSCDPLKIFLFKEGLVRFAT
jgi:tubulin polyglutamylase TTLL6/13